MNNSIKLALIGCLILLDINGTYVHVYEKPPTALEFLRTSVHPNRPAVIKSKKLVISKTIQLC